MNNFEKLKSLNICELAEWIDKHFAFDSAPSMVWFDKKYCLNCPAIMAKYEGCDRELPFSYCELNKKCKFFSEMSKVPDSLEITKLWLESEYDS